MDGLLAKANILKSRITSTARQAPASFAADKEAEVMAEMNTLLEQSRLEITETTLAFSARSSGVLFPVLINIGALTLLVVLGAFFFLRLNQDEVSLVKRSAQLGSAEGLIVEALKEASEEELSRKEGQIQSIQSMLREAEQTKASLIQEFDKERSLMQDKLRDELSQELDLERQRLIAAGLGEAAVTSRLAAFETQKQSEYQAKLSAANADFDRQLQERSAQFNSQMEEYRRSLAQAQDDQESIKRSLEQQLTKTRQESQAALESLSADKAAAVAELENLGRRQENAKLIEGRILSMYDTVNAKLSQEEYQAALAELDTLESFIGSAEALRVASVAERKNTEQFLVASLRRLISNELALASSQATTLAAASASSLLSAINSRVEEGNRLYAAGKLEAAKAEYTAALTQIPQLDVGYSRLQEMASRQLDREKALLDQQLSEAATLYRNNQYQASVERYRQALALIEAGDTKLASTLNDVLDAGYRLRKAAEPPPQPVVIREELAPEDKELLLRAKAADTQRVALLQALERLKTNYEVASGDSNLSTSQEAMVLLLNAKMLIRRALANKEIRDEYPDLYKTLDAVFESYGEEQRTVGRNEALRDLISLTGYLSSPEEDRDQPTLSAGEETRQRQLLLEFLGNLQILLAWPGQS